MGSESLTRECPFTIGQHSAVHGIGSLGWDQKSVEFDECLQSTEALRGRCQGLDVQSSCLSIKILDKETWSLRRIESRA
jgi:hypothetical protein